MGILGPSQPYLAYMVGVTNKEINLVWTAMTGGSCLATLAVGAVFNVRVTSHHLIFITRLESTGTSLGIWTLFYGLCTPSMD